MISADNNLNSTAFADLEKAGTSQYEMEQETLVRKVFVRIFVFMS